MPSNQDHLFTEIGESILISLINPYKNVVRVLSFNLDVSGENSSAQLKKEFRWSIDNITYSDYQELSNENLLSIRLSSSNSFWIEYRLTVESLDPEEDLIFRSISLQTETVEGTIEIIPQFKCCDNSVDSLVDNLIIDCKEGDLFNPYAIGGGAGLYSNLSSVVSSIFGHCVNFFKTAADQRSKDVMFHEYSLLNVIANKEVKILFPDNELPTREIQFDPIQMDNNIGVIEIHVVKREFERIFGQGSKPEEGDYLYIPIMKQMYQVQSIANPDDFLYQSSYWRVGLSKYEERASRIFTDEASETLTNNLVSGMQDLDVELNVELENYANPKQLKVQSIDSLDDTRRSLNKSLWIEESDLYSNWTLISKFSYDLSTINPGEVGLYWNYNFSISENENRSFQFLFKSKSYKLGKSIQIVSISDHNGFVKLTLDLALAETVKIIKIFNNPTLNGYFFVKQISFNEVILDHVWDTSYSNETGSYLKETDFYQVVKNDNEDFIIAITATSTLIRIGDSIFTFDHELLVEDVWYGFILNISNIYSSISLNLWKLSDYSNKPQRNNKSKFVKILEDVLQVDNPIIEKSRLGLFYANLSVSNFRIYDVLLEREDQEKKLMQYLVKNSSSCLLIDNAIPSLRLNIQERYKETKDINNMQFPASTIIDDEGNFIIDQNNNTIIG